MDYRSVDNKYLFIFLSNEESRALCKISPAINELLNCKNPENISLSADALDTAASRLLIRMISEGAAITGMESLFSEPLEPLYIDFRVNSDGESIKSTVIRVCKESDADDADVNIQYDDILPPEPEPIKPKKLLSVKIKNKSYVYRFDDFFDAKDCIYALKSHSIIPIKCVLWRMNDRHYLLMKIPPANRRLFANIMSEFGENQTDLNDNIFHEYGRKISDDFYNEMIKNGQK